VLPYWVCTNSSIVVLVIFVFVFVCCLSTFEPRNNAAAPWRNITTLESRGTLNPIFDNIYKPTHTHTHTCLHSLTHRQTVRSGISMFLIFSPVAAKEFCTLIIIVELFIVALP